MYHQFKELADVDITKGPMEVGPTCHYMMGGIRVDAETAQSTIPGLFVAASAARWPSRFESPGREFALRSARLRPSRRTRRRGACQTRFRFFQSTTRKSIKPKKNCLLPFPTPARKVLMLCIVICRKVMQNLDGFIVQKEFGKGIQSSWKN